MAKTVKRAYRYRFYPSPGQETELLRTFRCVRKVWNLALEARTRGVVSAAGTRHPRAVVGDADGVEEVW
jgi:helix-turn-helix protein